MRTTIPVFFAVDDNYVKLLHVVLTSLKANASKEYNYNIHVICEGLKKENIKSLETFNDDNTHVYIENVSDVAGERAKLMDGKYYGGRATYYRAFIPRLFPQYDKVMYIDADTTINGDISEFFNIDLKGNYIGATTDGAVVTNPVFCEYVVKFVGHKKPADYFNAGVILLNTAILRKINFEEKFFDVLNKIQLDVAPDQDVLNYLCKGKVKYIPDIWNRMPIAGGNMPLSEIKLVHYNLTTKPWFVDNIMYGELFWKYAEKTMFYKDILAIKKEQKPKDLEIAMNKVGIIMGVATECTKGKSMAQQLIDFEDVPPLAFFAHGGHVHNCAMCGACCGKRRG